MEYTPADLNESIKCNCRRMLQKGLPCRHILRVLKHLKLSKMPSCCVLKRLSKEARGGLPSKRASDLFGWGWASAEEREAYGEICQLQAQAASVAVKDPFLMKKLRDALEDIISYQHVPKVNEDGTSHVSKENSQPFRVHSVSVGDPLKVSTKGGRKKGTQGK